MVKNKVRPHDSHESGQNKSNFKNTNGKLKDAQTSVSGGSKFKHGKVEKPKYNQNKQFGGKIRNNKVDVQREKITDENKKPFDKKTWRLKKYSKKYKLEQWEEKRKKAMLTEYYKQIKNDDDSKKFDVQKIYDQYFDSDEERQTNAKVNYVSNPDLHKIDVEKIVVENEHIPEDKPTNEVKSPKKKLSAYQRAQLEYQRIQDEKKQKREEYVRQKAEKEEALKKYKKNKMEKYKKLSKKTRKGQPIMKDRMEMLFEKIQSTSV